MAKTVITARDIEILLAKGGSFDSLPADAIITPSARDLMREKRVAPKGGAKSASSAAAAPGLYGTPEGNKRLDCPKLDQHKRDLCDIGRRLWERAYVDGNGGNLCIRLEDDLVLCTPTLVSKGFMKPEDMCLVDINGKQVGGRKKATSEVLTHLAVMRAQPKAIATAHCHPPYATAFAVAGVKPPTCMIPEIEVFIGDVPIAPYSTPGTPAVGEDIAKLVDKHNTVLMANHGAISWSNTIEDAYFKMEILEAYCRTVVVGTHLGKELNTFSPKHLQDLLTIKKKLGVPDSRHGLTECQLCDNDEWRPGVTCTNHGGVTEGVGMDPTAEKLVQEITNQILAQGKR